MQLGVATLETDLDGALALGRQALALAEGDRSVLLSASFEAEALVLGALQLESTLRGRSTARFDVPILRRATTGTEAQLSGKVLYHALGLPRLDALFPDASPRTLLNRNLRAFLRGYTAAGVPLRYFGTEVLSLLGHPVALVGYDVTASGALLLELLIGLENPCVVRPALKREPPAALFPLLRRAPAPHDFLRSAVDGIVARLEASAVDLPALPDSPPLPLPLLSVPAAPVAVAIPLGVVEAALSPRVSIFGDLLASRAALKALETAAQLALDNAGSLPDAVSAALAGAPLDGARPQDLLVVIEEAVRRRPAVRS